MRAHQVLAVTAAAVLVATALSARRRAPGAVPADAIAYHGAWQLYRTLAVYFGKRALVAEARYWEAVSA